MTQAAAIAEPYRTTYGDKVADAMIAAKVTSFDDAAKFLKQVDTSSLMGGDTTTAPTPGSTATMDKPAAQVPGSTGASMAGDITDPAKLQAGKATMTAPVTQQLQQTINQTPAVAGGAPQAPAATTPAQAPVQPTQQPTQALPGDLPKAPDKRGVDFWDVITGKPNPNKVQRRVEDEVSRMPGVTDEAMYYIRNGQMPQKTFDLKGLKMRMDDPRAELMVQTYLEAARQGHLSNAADLQPALDAWYKGDYKPIMSFRPQFYDAAKEKALDRQLQVTLQGMQNAAADRRAERTQAMTNFNQGFNQITKLALLENNVPFAEDDYGNLKFNGMGGEGAKKATELAAAGQRIFQDVNAGAAKTNPRITPLEAYQFAKQGLTPQQAMDALSKRGSVSGSSQPSVSKPAAPVAPKASEAPTTSKPLPRVNSKEDAARLPTGTRFIGPDGKEYIKK